jgi:hypothetical protein
MATIQFLAGNPKSGKPKKAIKKAGRSPAQKANDKRLGMMAKARHAKGPKKPSAKKSVKKTGRKPMSASAKKAFVARMSAARGIAKKSVKKGSKKSNPQSYKYKFEGNEFRGMTFPTRQDIAQTLEAKKKVIASKKSLPKGSKKQDALVKEIRDLTLLASKQQRELKQGLDENAYIRKSGGTASDHVEDSAKYESSRKSSDIAKKKAYAAASSAAGAARKVAKKKLEDAKIKKSLAAKKAQQTKQGVFKVAKKKARKKVAKKVTKKVTAKKASPKKARKKASKKSSKKGAKKANPRKKKRSFFSFKKKSNPSISSVTGQSDNMAVAGLAIGGFSYNLFNDLGKRYLPSKVMEYIAMAGPVSGAVIPSAVAGLVLWASSKYPQNKALKHASGIAKGVIASAVVIAGASVYQVVAQAPVKKFIGLSGDESMYGEEMYGQSDIEFSGQADSEFSGQAMSEFSGDEDEFGEDEF